MEVQVKSFLGLFDKTVEKEAVEEMPTISVSKQFSLSFEIAINISILHRQLTWSEI